MLEGLFHHKKEEKDYLCALIVNEDRIDAALWETTADNKVVVLKTASCNYAQSWDKAIAAADTAISEIEDELPEGKELTKVVLGLYPEWLTEDRIKETYLKHLKQLTTSLSLKPMGFVELPLAIAHLLHHDEGVQQTVILVGIESQHITVSLFKIGKSSGSKTFTRTPDISADVEKALTTFTDVEVLPSRVLLYGTDPTLEKLKAELLNYPWQRKANFIHFPKIEILKADFAVKAVAVASSTEITPTPAESVSEVSEKQIQPAVPDTADEVVEIAEDLGFTKDQTADLADTSEVKDELQLNESKAITDSEEVNTVEVSVPKAIPKPRKFNLSLPKLTMTFKIPNLPKWGLIAGVLLLVLVVGMTLMWIIRELPKAQVKILVIPQQLERADRITVDLKAQQVNPEKRELPGHEVKLELTGSKSIPTTGKKNIGDKAKGEVNIFNKTLNIKTFKKGAFINAGKISFTLDEEVKVASASENVGSLTYGTNKGQLTAKDIGNASNVAPATEFVFVDLPSTSYTARNDKAFTGGSSREILVVAREDQIKVREAVVGDLEKQAQSELGNKLNGNQKLVENSVTSNVTKETFTKEIGEEAEQLSGNLQVTVTGLTYNQADMELIVDKIIQDNQPVNYQYKKSDVQTQITEVTFSKEGNTLLLLIVNVNLLPKIEISDLSQKLAGKSLTAATEIVHSQPAIAGVEFQIDAPFAFLKQQLPVNSKHITIDVASL